MNSLKYDYGGLGPIQAIRVKPWPMDGRVQRLCWLLARLGLRSPRWHLPVGIDPDGTINTTVLPHYEVE